MAPQNRPPHPLFGGGGGNPHNDLMAQIKARGETPAAVTAGGNKSAANVTQAQVRAPPPEPKRLPAVKAPPPAAGGAPPMNALFAQIKSRGETPAAVSAGGQKAPPAAAASTSSAPISRPPPNPMLAQIKSSAPLKSVSNNKPPASSPKKNPPMGGQMSLADQVAMMAKKRTERINEESERAANDGNNDGTIQESSTPVAPPAPKPVSPSPKPGASVESATNKKKGGFFGATVKKDEPKKKGPVVVTPQKPQQTEEAFIIKSYKPEPLPAPEKKAPSYAQARLKPTGLRDDSPATELANATEPQKPEMAPLPTTTTTTTVTKTKRVTKSDPEYEIVEYKVGCACTIM